MEPRLSVCKPDHGRPLFIFGQDETAIKQHIYSNKCWYDHLGQDELDEITRQRTRE